MSRRLQPGPRLCVEPLEPRTMLSIGGVVGMLPSLAARVGSSVRDDYGNTFAQATQVSLATKGAGTQSGRVERAGDVDMFKIVATVSGKMAITQSASAGSRLDSYLYIYDATGKLLARNDDDGATLNSRVEISAVAGTTYYVKAAAYQRSTGAYTVAFETVADVTTPDSPTTPDTSNTPPTSTSPVSGAFQIDVTMTGFSCGPAADHPASRRPLGADHRRRSARRKLLRTSD